MDPPTTLNNTTRGGGSEDNSGSDRGGEVDDDDEIDDDVIDDEDDGEGTVGGTADHGRAYARLGGPFIAISEIVEVGLAHESDCEDWTAGMYRGPLTGDPKDMAASGYTSL